MFQGHYFKHIFEEEETEPDSLRRETNSKTSVSHLTPSRPCPHCRKQFSSTSALKMHIKLHTGEKENQCKVCLKHFVQPGNLKQHMLVHTGERIHNCSVCSKKFTHLSDCNRHMLIHTGEKPYQCSVCQKKFTQISTFKRHARTVHFLHHCTVCVETFPDKEDLQKHALVHQPESKRYSSEKSLECGVCKRKFKHQSRLNLHLERQHLRSQLMTD